MPKIINPDSISIESLTDKLNGLQSQFTSLEKKHSVLQDSIQSLNQSMIKAEIATSFYDTHLATYTQIFAIVVAIILAIATLVNWLALIKPQERKINNIINSFKKQYIDDIVENLNETTSYLYRNIAISYQQSEPEVSFLFSIRLLKIQYNIKIDSSFQSDWIKHSLDFLNVCNFNKKEHEEPYIEIIETLTFLIKETENEEDIKILKQISSQFSSKMNDLFQLNENQLELNL